MGDRCGMSISADSPSDETLNRGTLGLLLRRQYEFPFGINIVQFSIFQFFPFSIKSLSGKSQENPRTEIQINGFTDLYDYFFFTSLFTHYVC